MQSAPWATVELNESFRFHPILAKLISQAGYNGSFTTRILPLQRSVLTGCQYFPLPRQAYPVGLIHQVGRTEHLATKSSRNLEQCDMAIALTASLARTVNQIASVAICCYYAGDAIHIAETMQQMWGTEMVNEHGVLTSNPQAITALGGLEVRTVHGYIGQEAEVAIVVTGASKTGSEWVFQREPGNVAISRGRQGLFIIGNMDHLASQQANTIGNFVRAVAEECPAVDGKVYRTMLEEAARPNVVFYRAHYVKNKPLAQPDAMIARCELNRANGWHQ
ncbi:MAG TPA: AAA domain-containing protein [Nitrososphaera sp.]|nr:AAA domain-containing protein [Nitrososphaera sp.]